MGTGSSFPKEKQPVNEVGHSLLSSAEVKNEWCYTSVPHVLYLHDTDGDKFTFGVCEINILFMKASRLSC